MPKSRKILQDALLSKNVQAFLRAIRLGEGTSDKNGYRRLVGGGEFDGYDRHPGRKVWIERYQIWSSAAGAYQFIMPTWNGLVSEWGFDDFSPTTQDEAAVALILEKNALKFVMAGRIPEAVDRCKKIWASLPGSPYGQRTESMDRFVEEYVRHGGKLAEE